MESRRSFPDANTSFDAELGHVDAERYEASHVSLRICDGFLLLDQTKAFDLLSQHLGCETEELDCDGCS